MEKISAQMTFGKPQLTLKTKHMNLTAREWIELIADPEIREKALANIENHELTKYTDLDKRHKTFADGLEGAFWWLDAPEGKVYWMNLYETPPALLPFPNKEREAAEAVLKEFAKHINADDTHTATLFPQDITDFLNQKYPSNG